MMYRFCLMLIVMMLSWNGAKADWPQFLGTNRDSSSKETIPAWTGELKPLWKQAVGEAHSSPVVADGVVYSFAKVAGKEADSLTAFDAKTGKKLWQKSYDRGPFSNFFGNGPRSTPTINDGKIYTLSSTGVLTCWDAKNGDIAWSVDTLKEFNAKNITFGVSTSPTVVGDNVIIMVGGKGAGIVGFNKNDGKVVWQATDDTASYASPIPVGTGNNTDLVFLTNSHVRSVRAKTGKEIWQVPFVDKLLESSTTPVKVGELFVAGSVMSGSIGVQIEKSNSQLEPKKLWANKLLTCYFSTPVAVGDYLYMVNGMASLNNASITLRCVEAKTGKVMWTEKNVGKYHAALLKTGDDKLIMHSDNGNLYLLDSNIKEYTELAKSKVCRETWAHPALSDGLLYIRDDKELLCFQVGK